MGLRGTWRILDNGTWMFGSTNSAANSELATIGFGDWARWVGIVQGDMKGELRWDELRDIRYSGRPSFFTGFAVSYADLQGIKLKVAGATIVIADVYDRPLSLIHERLLGYWEEYVDEDD